MPVAPLGAVAAPPAPPRSGALQPSFAAALRSRAPALPACPRAASPAHPAVAVLAEIDRAQARLDAVLAAARAGRTFTAGELIGLQAEAYRCAQTVDLASKLVEQGAQAVKQAQNTQL